MSAMTTANFGEMLEIGLKHIYGLTYQSLTPEYPRYMDIESSDGAYEEGINLSGFGVFPEKGEGSGLQYVSGSQGWLSRIVNVTYGLGFIITMEMMQDNKYQKFRAFPAALARSVMYTKEVLCADILNDAFDSTARTGGDGLELCSTAHLLKGGGTFRNELSIAADLSETSLKQAILDIGSLVDDESLLIAPTPKMLIVHRDNQFNAKVLLGSSQVTDSVNNDINPVQNIMPWMVANHLDDPDAWFIKTSVPYGITYQNRMEPVFSRDNDFDSKNAKFSSVFRCGRGWFDPRGIFGSPGA